MESTGSDQTRCVPASVARIVPEQFVNKVLFVLFHIKLFCSGSCTTLEQNRTNNIIAGNKCGTILFLIVPHWNNMEQNEKYFKENAGKRC